MDYTVTIAEATGLIQATRRQCDFVGYRLSREHANEDFKDPRFKDKGVYVLVSRENNGLRVYVGDTSEVKGRFSEHCNKKTEKFDWQVALIFINDRREMAWNGDMTYDIQSIVLRNLRERGFEAEDNVQMPRLRTPEREHAVLEDIAKDIDGFFPILGFPELARSTGKKIVSIRDEVYECMARGCKGKGILVERQFKVFKGSRCTTQVNKLHSDWPSAKAYDKLRADGVIDAKGCFTRDYVLSSPSRAVEVLSLCANNGLGQWRLNGKELGDVHPELRRAKK